MSKEIVLKIWHISDTHMNQGQLQVPTGVDLVIHTGDASNWRDPYRNEPEMRAFIDWFAALQIPNKVFVAGNHDTSVEKGLVSRELMTSRGITYLQDEEATFGGLRIWGAPWTPTYGDWSFMRGRHKMHSIWSSIPEGIDILATHGPPYGILDATYSQNNRVELCGDVSLMKRVQELQPQLVCFGHIHSTDDIRNAGTRTVHGLRTIFSNGSCVDDGKWGIITSHGNVIDI